MGRACKMDAEQKSASVKPKIHSFAHPISAFQYELERECSDRLDQKGLCYIIFSTPVPLSGTYPEVFDKAPL